MLLFSIFKLAPVCAAKETKVAPTEDTLNRKPVDSATSHAAVVQLLYSQHPVYGAGECGAPEWHRKWVSFKEKSLIAPLDTGPFCTCAWLLPARLLYNSNFPPCVI